MDAPRGGHPWAMSNNSRGMFVAWNKSIFISRNIFLEGAPPRANTITWGNTITSVFFGHRAGGGGGIRYSRSWITTRPHKRQGYSWPSENLLKEQPEKWQEHKNKNASKIPSIQASKGVEKSEIEMKRRRILITAWECRTKKQNTVIEEEAHIKFAGSSHKI